MAVQPGLCWTWSETPKTSFLASRLKYHQIATLSVLLFIVQWLVKRAIETREEVGDYIRKFSVSQFNKHHKTPEVCHMLGTISESFLSHSSINIIKHQRYFIMLGTISRWFLSHSSINIIKHQRYVICWRLYQKVFCCTVQ